MTMLLYHDESQTRITAKLAIKITISICSNVNFTRALWVALDLAIPWDYLSIGYPGLP